MRPVRRVATGKGGIAFDGQPSFVIPSADGGPEVTMLWSTDGVASVPGADDDPLDTLSMDALFPGPAGTRFMIVEHPPGAGVTGGFGGTPEDLAAYGLDEHGMHASDSVDYAVVVSGRICVELGDGPEVELGPGDCLVQNGTLHAWRNRSDEPARVAIVIVGANRS